MTLERLGPPTHYLSHPLDAATPAYGNGAGFVGKSVSRIADGATANSQRWEFPNHLGTHLDAPRHFFDDGYTVDAAPPSAWWFSAPVLVDIPLDADSLIGIDTVAALVPPSADLLLLRTGFESRRSERAYWERNPGLSGALGLWCRAERPALRAIGMDLISVTGRAHREEGRAAHHALLDPAGNGSPVILIEDMALAHSPTKFRAVCVAPLRVVGGDGGPCTVFAWSGGAI